MENSEKVLQDVTFLCILSRVCFLKEKFLINQINGELQSRLLDIWKLSA